MNVNKIIYQLDQIRKDYLVGAVTATALAQVDATFYNAEFCALQGPSGSGKSTLLNILGLLESPTSGAIRFDGVDVGSLTETELTIHRRRSIGFIFQNFNLVSTLSALENVEYPLFLEDKRGKTDIKEKAMQALKEVGLERFAHHRPSQLSGGQRQRVAIARAIVKKPRVILADEPTANLDSKTALQIIELLHELKERSQTCLIVATHDPHVAELADRQVHLKDGKIDETNESDITPQRLHNIDPGNLKGGVDPGAPRNSHT